MVTFSSHQQKSLLKHAEVNVNTVLLHWAVVWDFFDKQDLLKLKIFGEMDTQQ